MPALQKILTVKPTKLNLPKLKRDVMNLYISQCWPIIERGRLERGWPQIFEDFQSFVASISDSLEIDEETFRKALQRYGIRNVGRVGAPRKLG